MCYSILFSKDNGEDETRRDETTAALHGVAIHPLYILYLAAEVGVIRRD